MEPTNECEPIPSKQGLPTTIEELRATVINSVAAFFLGAAWATWIGRGVDRSICPTAAILPDGWDAGIFADDPDSLRQFRKENLYQFLLRGIIRDCGQFVENFMDHNDLVPRHRGQQRWSKGPSSIYVLRILRNGFNHDWTIGRVYDDVEWNEIVFRKNVDGTIPPVGFAQTDDLLARLPQGSGAIEIVRELMDDVLYDLEELWKSTNRIPTASPD